MRVCASLLQAKFIDSEPVLFSGKVLRACAKPLYLWERSAMVWGLCCSNLPPGWGLGELLSHWLLMPGCETGCCTRLFGGGCAVCSTCTHLAHASSVLSVLHKLLRKRCSFCVWGSAPFWGDWGQHHLFLERSTWRQCLCLEAGSNSVCSLNTLSFQKHNSCSKHSGSNRVGVHAVLPVDLGVGCDSASADSGCSIGRCREIACPVCCSCWRDVEKGEACARRGEAELGKTLGRIWGKCEASSAP